MPLSAAAESELRTILRTFKAAHSGAAVPSGAGKALEAFIFFKLAQTVQLRMSPTWRVTLCRGDGSPFIAAATFDLPGGPSKIQASSPTAPGFVLLEYTADPTYNFELRGSVQWMGRSNAKHEIDISVLPAMIGERIRNYGGGYPHGLPIAAIECKDKPGVGNLDETRQTLARMFDLALVTQPHSGWSCRNYETRTNLRWGHRSSKYISFFAKSHIAIVRAGSFSSGVTTLSQHYMIGGYPSIYTDPATINALQADFRMNLHRAIDY